MKILISLIFTALGFCSPALAKLPRLTEKCGVFVVVEGPKPIPALKADGESGLTLLDTAYEYVQNKLIELSKAPQGTRACIRGIPLEGGWFAVRHLTEEKGQ